eukprot:TRINITY_DN76739_c0_g1_i1.p1 TRINITY_DN76739_c0_g1~~TRINITY_DN76739_c0_g1_i1.p1  ORF type:complete len:123 (-),score=17.84 TRINITY_DN76739_c0_g1_i1:10-378(-)
MVSAIMCTDMSGHFRMVGEIKRKDDLSPFNSTKPVDRQEMLNMIIHTADLSGQALPQEIAIKWEDCITREFQMQVAKEERLGLPVAPFMQNLQDLCIRNENQEIGRAVQQECRDRSRMPSSA